MRRQAADSLLYFWYLVTHVFSGATVVMCVKTQAVFKAVWVGNLEGVKRLLEWDHSLLNARSKVQNFHVLHIDCGAS